MHWSVQPESQAWHRRRTQSVMGWNLGGPGERTVRVPARQRSRDDLTGVLAGLNVFALRSGTPIMVPSRQAGGARRPENNLTELRHARRFHSSVGRIDCQGKSAPERQHRYLPNSFLMNSCDLAVNPGFSTPLTRNGRYVYRKFTDAQVAECAPRRGLG